MRLLYACSWRNDYFCSVNRQSNVKYALNLSAFLLILGGISLLDHGAWSVAGLLMLLAGLAVAAYAVYTVYMRKSVKMIAPRLVFLSAVSGLLLLTVAQFFVSRKSVNWELQLVFLAAATYIFWVSRMAGSTGKKSS